jgi:phospholipase/carboxylesterase
MQYLEAATSEKPTASIIVMHGLGASADDFAPFVREIPLPDVRWIFPQAPDMPVSINGGYRMPAWYDIRPDRSDEDAAGLKQSQAAIEALIEHEIERGIPAERVVLGGFSQGCAMALLAGLRFGKTLAGVIGMSGYLPLAAEYEAAKARGEFSANSKTPVFLAHGTQDDIVGLDRGAASRDRLLALGHAIDWREYPMPHSVCPAEVRDLHQWLQRLLVKA